MLAIIGGTGLTNLANLEIVRREVVRTPYGEPSGHLTFGKIGDAEMIFLARHGYAHTIAPHEVNYRANIWALAKAGATRIVAVNAVGGIAENMGLVCWPCRINSSITPTAASTRFLKAMHRSRMSM